MEERASDMQYDLDKYCSVSFCFRYCCCFCFCFCCWSKAVCHPRNWTTMGHICYFEIFCWFWPRRFSVAERQGIWGFHLAKSCNNNTFLI